MTEQTRKIFRVPLQIYDISAGEYRAVELYIHSPKTETGDWYSLMQKAQNSGLRLAYSPEWFRGRQHLQREHPEAEIEFVEGPMEWTGTVLDFNDETLKEGIILNPDGTIKSANITLGKKEGIILPDESKYVKELDDKYMPLARQLWGVDDPKRELPDYTYLWIDPNGQRPVVRGYWGVHRRDSRRVDVGADFGPAGGRFAARLVSETKPENSITPEEYRKLVEELNNKPVLIE